MNPTVQIPLNNNWLCEYFEHEPAVNESAAASVIVPALNAWNRGNHHRNGWLACLQRGVFLEPTEQCVSYVLHIDSAPGRVLLNVNGRRLGYFDGVHAFEFDITDYVALEDNTLELHVDCGAPGSFGRVYLEQAPCE